MHAVLSSAADAWKAQMIVLACIAELDCSLDANTVVGSKRRQAHSSCPRAAFFDGLSSWKVSDFVWV